MSDALINPQDALDFYNTNAMAANPSNPSDNPLGWVESGARGLYGGTLDILHTAARLGNAVTHADDLQYQNRATMPAYIDRPPLTEANNPYQEDWAEGFFSEADKDTAALMRQNEASPALRTWAGNVVYSAAHGISVGFQGAGLGLGAWGPALTMGATQGVDTYDTAREQGVDNETALGLARRSGAAGAAMAFVAPAFGKTLPIRILTGAGIGVGFGAANRTLMSSYLRDRGYHDLADRYKAFDAEQMTIDAIIGGAFGLLPGHHNDSRPDPEAVTAALVHRDTLDREVAFGIPENAAARRFTGEALSRMERQAENDEPIDPGDVPEDVSFIERPHEQFAGLTPDQHLDQARQLGNDGEYGDALAHAYLAQLGGAEGARDVVRMLREDASPQEQAGIMSRVAEIRRANQDAQFVEAAREQGASKPELDDLIQQLRNRDPNFDPDMLASVSRRWEDARDVARNARDQVIASAGAGRKPGPKTKAARNEMILSLREQFGKNRQTDGGRGRNLVGSATHIVRVLRGNAPLPDGTMIAKPYPDITRSTVLSVWKRADDAARAAQIAGQDINDIANRLGIPPERVRAVSAAKREALASAAREPLGVTVDEVKAAASDIFGADWEALAKAGKVEVVQSRADVAAGSFGLPRGTQAVHFSNAGKTYFIANNIDINAMRGLVLHEIGVHHGLEDYVGARGMEEIFRQLRTMVEADHPAVVEARAFAERYTLNKNDVDEETLAYLVENHADLPLVQSILSRLRQWLVKTFGSTFGMRLTVDDLRALAVSSFRRAAVKAHREAVGVSDPIAEIRALASQKDDAPDARALDASNTPDGGGAGSGNVSDDFLRRHGINPTALSSEQRADLTARFQAGTQGPDGLVRDANGRRIYPEPVVQTPEMAAQRLTNWRAQSRERALREEQRISESRANFRPRTVGSNEAPSLRTGFSSEEGERLYHFESGNRPFEVTLLDTPENDGTLVTFKSLHGDPYGWGSGQNATDVYRNVVAAIRDDARANPSNAYIIGGFDKRFAALNRAMAERLARRGELPDGYIVEQGNTLANGNIVIRRATPSNPPARGGVDASPEWMRAAAASIPDEPLPALRAPEPVSAPTASATFGSNRNFDHIEIVGRDRGPTGLARYAFKTESGNGYNAVIRPYEGEGRRRFRVELERDVPDMRNQAFQSRDERDAAGGIFNNPRYAQTNENEAPQVYAGMQDAIVRDMLTNRRESYVIGGMTQRLERINAALAERAFRRGEFPPEYRLEHSAEGAVLTRSNPPNGGASDFPKFSVRQNGSDLVRGKRDPIESEDYQQRLRNLRESLSGKRQGEAGKTEGRQAGTVGGVAGDHEAGRRPSEGRESPAQQAAREKRELRALTDISGIELTKKTTVDRGEYRLQIDTPFASEHDAVLRSTKKSDTEGGPTWIDFDMVDGSNPKETRLPGIYLKHTRVNDGARGLGIGAWMYRQLIEWADRRGLPVYSDDLTVSPEAQKTYARLAEMGYDFKQFGPSKKLPDGTRMGLEKGKPVFVIGMRGEITEPLRSAPLPRDDYQIDGPTLRDRQKPIDEQRAREEAYNKLSPVEQALADGKVNLSVNPRKGGEDVSGRDLLDSTEAERDQAKEMKKGFDAAARCAARHGVEASIRDAAGNVTRGVVRSLPTRASFVTLRATAANALPSADAAIGQILGMGAALPLGITATPLLWNESLRTAQPGSWMRQTASAPERASARQAGEDAGLDNPSPAIPAPGRGLPVTTAAMGASSAQDTIPPSPTDTSVAPGPNVDVHVAPAENPRPDKPTDTAGDTAELMRQFLESGRKPS